MGAKVSLYVTFASIKREMMIQKGFFRFSFFQLTSGVLLYQHSDEPKYFRKSVVLDPQKYWS